MSSENTPTPNEEPLKLIYWGGNFAGRGEFVRLVLSYLDLPFDDVSRSTNNPTAPLEYVMMYKGKLSETFKKADEYPVLFPPILVDGDVTLNQTTAILIYLAKKAGGNLIPSGIVDEAHMLQIMLAAFDCLTGAEHAHHPVRLNDSYLSQQKEADEAMTVWAKERLPAFLAQLERALAFVKDDYFVGGAVSLADLVVFQLMRGYSTSLKEHYNANETIPLLKAHTARFYQDPKVKAFLESDKCTKMEAPDASPTAQAPQVQLNSFM